MTSSLLADPLPRRDAGRPRVYSDDAIFAATDLVLLRDGYQMLTLEAISTEVGCTRQALVRRFGSKRYLIVQYLETMVERVAALNERELDSGDPPLELLRSRLSRPWAQRHITTIDFRQQANVLAFNLMLSHSSDVYTQFEELHRIARLGIETLLQAALERGDLQGIDPSVTAHVLYDAWIGATINWCLDPTTERMDRIGRTYGIIIGPHCTSSR